MALAQALRSSVKRIVPITLGAYLLRRRPTGVDRATWDRQYAAGEWDFLGGISEMPRFSVIAGYCRTTAAGGSVLDIGCGIGTLRRWLDDDQRYVGVDVSEAAIQRARETAPGNARFEAADAVAFQPRADERFDVVVLSEMLFYIDRPEALVARCAGFLASGGAIVLSMYRSSEALLTWRRCSGLLDVLDEIELRRVGGLGWHVRLCRPRHHPAERAYAEPAR